MARERFYSCVTINEPSGQESDRVEENSPEEVVETQVTNNKSSKVNIKKRPRIKTHAKRIKTHDKSMIQARRNYTKRREPEQESENEETGVFVESANAISDSSNEDEIGNNEIEDVTIDRSPKPKRRKTDEEIERMYWSIEGVAALKEIESLTQNIEIIDLINCFNTESAEKNSFNETKEKMRECTRTWNEKDQKMIDAIEFIENEGKKEYLKSLKFEELVTCLTLTINNRMPKKCNECKDLYRINIHNQPILRCMMCNVGMHDCKKIDKNELVSGILWICTGCKTDCIANKVFENAKKQIILNMIGGKNTKSKNTDVKHSEVKTTTMGNNKRKRIQEDYNIIEVEAEIHKAQTAPVNRQEGRNIGKPKDNEVKNDNEKEQKRKMDKVCRFWATGKCKFGSNCHYAHPVLCPVILEKGTCNQEECKFFHPRMCSTMKQTGHCQRGERCFYTHFKETRSRIMSDRSSNRRDLSSYQLNEIASRNKHWNNNQQWDHSRGHSNEYNQYNQMQGHHMDFYMNQDQNWKAMTKPVMERAAEILAEKMMWGNQ